MKFLKLLFSQVVIVGILLALQVVFIILTVLRLAENFVYLYLGLVLLSFFAVLFVVNKPDSPSYKLAWVIPILTFPVFGGLFYLIVYRQRHTRYLRRKLRMILEYSARFIPQKPEVARGLTAAHPQLGRMVRYMNDCAGYSVSQGSEADYYPLGEEMKAAMMAAMEGAEKYIFLEFFIIKPGVFWDEMLELMERKAGQGVDVRLLYDGMGSRLLPMGYHKRLQEKGIGCRVFSPFRPLMSTIQNNRDHRKLCVVDGHTAFCGGLNLADEYINVTAPYGHWKDTGVKVTGEAAFSFTAMFLQLWELNEQTLSDYEQYRPALPPRTGDGYVMPFGDSPLDNETVGEFMYMEVINSARSYLHIMSPYLILEHSMVTAICNAAKSGVDVKIIVPHVSDHWYAHAVAKAYYWEMTLAGVRIYEYMPGFVHAKSFVWDDVGAIVGTINLDYRSLYLHFECAVWFYQHAVVDQVKEDFDATLAVCKEISPQDCVERNILKRLLYSILRIFAPLM